MKVNKKKEIILSVFAIEKSSIGEHGEVIHIIGRDVKRKKHIINILNFKPYFYIDHDLTVPKDDRIVKVEEGYRTYDNKKVKKIVLNNSYDVGTKNHEGVKHYFNKDSLYECKIPFNRRAKINFGIKVGTKIIIQEKTNKNDKK